MIMSTNISRLVDREEKQWDAYVYSSHGTSHSQLSGWRHVIQSSYGHLPFYVWIIENGVPKGILPLILMRGRLMGRSLVSMPYLDDGGVFSEDRGVREELFREAQRLYEEHGVNHLDLRHRIPSGLKLSSTNSKVTLLLDLMDNSDRMWKQFNPKLRNQIRKAVKSELTVSWSGLDALPDFYEVFSMNMRDLGSPVHSRAFFTEILTKFRDSAKLLIVRKKDKAIGAGLCLSFKDTLMMPWASSLRSYRPNCPNNLLYWEAIRYGCEKGYRVFDFGRSGILWLHARE